MAYTDSKIQDIAIGDYLTRASAGTMYNTLNQKITTASGSLVSLSGSVVSNYWNSTTVQNKIIFGDSTYIQKRQERISLNSTP